MALDRVAIDVRLRFPIYILNVLAITLPVFIISFASFHTDVSIGMQEDWSTRDVKYTEQLADFIDSGRPQTKTQENVSPCLYDQHRLAAAVPAHQQREVIHRKQPQRALEERIMGHTQSLHLWWRPGEMSIWLQVLSLQSTFTKTARHYSTLSTAPVTRLYASSAFSSSSCFLFKPRDSPSETHHTQTHSLTIQQTRRHSPNANNALVILFLFIILQRP